VYVASGETRAVTPTKWEIGSLQWTPAGDQLVVSATDHPESDQQTSRIFALSPADGSMRELAAPRGFFGDIHVAPDGKTIY
jgi:dipeptidyl aminopeptidase/acylaminoacyl peptidase